MISPVQIINLSISHGDDHFLLIQSNFSIKFILKIMKYLMHNYQTIN